MAKQRHNISTISEILLDEIDSFKKAAIQLNKNVQQLQETKVDINPESIHQLNKTAGVLTKMLNDKKEEFSLLFRKIEYRAPNWVLALIISFGIICLGSSFFTYKQIQKITRLELENEHLLKTNQE